MPVVPSTLGRVTEMRDCYDLDIQLLADPDGEVAEQYSGTEETSHGITGISGVYVIDEAGSVVITEDLPAWKARLHLIIALTMTTDLEGIRETVEEGKYGTPVVAPSTLH